MTKYNSMVSSTYTKREKRVRGTIIEAHKINVNKCILKKSNKDGNFLIIDSASLHTTKIFKNNGYTKNITNISTDNPDHNYKTTLKDFSNYTNELYTNIWADTTNNTKNAFEQVEPLFRRNRISKCDGIFAITICPRRDTTYTVGHFDRRLKKVAIKYGYNLSPIIIDKQFRLKTKVKSKFNIKSHMTDNGGKLNTGRAITFLYRIN